MKAKNILVTGGYGFLGRNAAKHFCSLGYDVFGIGHGSWTQEEFQQWGLKKWLPGEVNIDSLKSFNVSFDIIVHCAGSGAVSHSFSEPMVDFEKNVNSTLSVLEYSRRCNPRAKLIIPSSPAVQGIHDDTPIKESDECQPVSPYGVHKKVAEDLCLSYHRHFNASISIIRFFSIYGEGLKKQLLWDACKKLLSEKEAVFWGTGEETRDFLHIDDAVSLIAKTAFNEDANISLVNGGSGNRVSISEVLELLKEALGVKTAISFNGLVRDGDPIYYRADISRATKLGWKPGVDLEEGIRRYARWFKRQVK